MSANWPSESSIELMYSRGIRREVVGRDAELRCVPRVDRDSAVRACCPADHLQNGILGSRTFVSGGMNSYTIFASVRSAAMSHNSPNRSVSCESRRRGAGDVPHLDVMRAEHGRGFEQ